MPSLITEENKKGRLVSSYEAISKEFRFRVKMFDGGNVEWILGVSELIRPTLSHPPHHPKKTKG